MMRYKSFRSGLLEQIVFAECTQMESDEILTTLKKCELFKHLDNDELDTLAKLCAVEEYGAGETIYGQGETGDRLYILSKGQVSLNRNYKLHTSRNADVVVYVLRETSNRRLIGGWCTLVGKEHVFMCSARCDRDSRLVVIDGKFINDLMADKPDIRIKILEKLILLLRGRLESSYESFESI
ncbi:MAG: cyclic nucleotide-binding domain-containing protein [Deltaproteobacteria bacterium]|nr:cyclic nucleotide-binding domain-containing protein [Deltaproteobacteria bacterium]